MTPVNECTGKGYRLEDLKLGEGLTTHQGNLNLLYFFWVIPLCPICTGRVNKKNKWKEMVGVFMRVKVWLIKSVGPPSDWSTLLLSQTFNCINTPTTLSQLLLLLKRSTKMEQSVPKRRHREFRRRGITQKKEYNIHNAAKVSN